jgi:hypothetical protein
LIIDDVESLAITPWCSGAQSYEQQRQVRLIACWQACGVGDALSAFNRSVPFTKVVQFYHELRHQVGDGLNIVDITNWRSYEQAMLRSIGVTCLDPAHGDVKDLADLVSCSVVITIDTALAHLSAAMGEDAIILFPKNFDERWHELRDARIYPFSPYLHGVTALVQRQMWHWDVLLQDALHEVLQRLP